MMAIAPPALRRGSAYRYEGAPGAPKCQVCGEPVTLHNGRLPWACSRCGAVIDPWEALQ